MVVVVAMVVLQDTSHVSLRIKSIALIIIHSNLSHPTTILYTTTPLHLLALPPPCVVTSHHIIIITTIIISVTQMKTDRSSANYSADTAKIVAKNFSISVTSNPYRSTSKPCNRCSKTRLGLKIEGGDKPSR